MRRHGDTEVITREEDAVTPLMRVFVPIILGLAIMGMAGMFMYRVAQSHVETTRLHAEEESRQLVRDSMTRLQRNDFEKAEQLADQAILLTPKSSTAYLFRAEARAGFLSTNKLIAAEEDYSTCLMLDPEEFMAYYGRGQVRYRLGKIEEAEDDYTAAIQLKPHYAAAFMARSIARKQLGKNDAAAEDLEQARKLGLIPQSLPRDKPAS